MVNRRWRRNGVGGGGRQNFREGVAGYCKPRVSIIHKSHWGSKVMPGVLHWAFLIKSRLFAYDAYRRALALHAKYFSPVTLILRLILTACLRMAWPAEQASCTVWRKIQWWTCCLEECRCGACVFSNVRERSMGLQCSMAGSWRYCNLNERAEQILPLSEGIDWEILVWHSYFSAKKNNVFLFVVIRSCLL